MTNTAILSSPRTVVCGRCSTGFGRDRVQVRHPIAQVKECFAAPAVAPIEDDNAAEYELAALELAVAPAPVVAPRPAISAGSVWLLDGVLHQVRKARSSDRLFAHRLCGSLVAGERPVWEYVGLASRVLAAAAPASAAVVAEFGHVSGWCVFCNRQLDDPRSTSAGYGPICAAKFGLAWG